MRISTLRFVGLGCVAAVLSYITVFALSRYLVICWALALSLFAAGLRRYLAPAVFSPVLVVVVGLVVFAILGSYAYPSVADAPGASGVTLHLDPGLVARTSRLLLSAATALLLTATAVSIARSAIASLTGRPRVLPPPGVSAAPEPGAVLTPRKTTLLLLAAVTPIPMTILAFGPSYLLSRTGYIVGSGGGPIGASALSLGTASVPILAYVVAFARGWRRLVAALAVSGYGLLLFSIGTRRLALLPVLVALGIFAARRTRATVLLVLCGAVASVYLLQLPLYLRSLPEHGLLNYWSALPSYFASRGRFDSIALNLLSGFPIIGATAFAQPPISFHNYLVSINPLPGGLVGWASIAPMHRLNVFTPYAAMGELGNVGTTQLILYFVATGLVLAWADGRNQVWLRERRIVAPLVSTALSGLFLLYQTQYNLRSATRLLYYEAGWVIALEVWRRVQGARERLHPRRVAGHFGVKHTIGHRAEAS